MGNPASASYVQIIIDVTIPFEVGEHLKSGRRMIRRLRRLALVDTQRTGFGLVWQATAVGNECHSGLNG